jgi:hypothetical protein
MRCAVYLCAAVLFGSVGVASAQGVDTGDASTVQVRCKDGTVGTAGRGACSHHGGVAKNEGAPAPTKTTPASVAGDEEKKVAPATPATGSPAMVKCKDGTTANQGRGACSRHGGVDKGSGAAPMAVPGAAPAQHAEKGSKAVNPKSELTTEPPAGTPDGAATARCKDGTMSHSKHHTGTCSGHGGVDKWLDSTP